MPIPDFQSLMLPVLKTLAGTSKTTAALVAEMTEGFGLSEDERSQLLPSGRQTTIANRIHWALAYLNRSGLIDRLSRGTYTASLRGLQVLERPPERITIGFLRQFPEFATLRPGDAAPGASLADAAESAAQAGEPTATPDEQITSAVTAIEIERRAEILQRLLSSSPKFFERVVVDLIVAMGYGSTQKDAAEALGGRGTAGWMA